MSFGDRPEPSTSLPDALGDSPNGHTAGPRHAWRIAMRSEDRSSVAQAFGNGVGTTASVTEMAVWPGRRPDGVTLSASSA